MTERACRVVVSRQLVAELLRLENVEATAFWMTDDGDLAIRLDGPGLPDIVPGTALPLYRVMSKQQPAIVSWLEPVE